MHSDNGPADRSLGSRTAATARLEKLGIAAAPEVGRMSPRTGVALRLFMEPWRELYMNYGRQVSVPFEPGTGLV